MVDDPDERELEDPTVPDNRLELELVRVGVTELLTAELEELLLDESERLELGASRVELAFVLDVYVE